MRSLFSALLITLLLSTTRGEEPKLIARPDVFPTLVNPNCSHCVDEAKRRGKELRDEDPVLVWTRGYSDGGAIPLRFFLGTYRVISDSYGVFVYDPDAGFARGFAPSYNFVFHGWRNGILVIKDVKDGTLYSALSGVAFAGPKKGQRLKSVPTLMSTWGEVMDRSPNAVAYQLFDKYKPVELPKEPGADSIKSRATKTDPRLKPDDFVMGVRIGEKTRAYPLAHLPPAVTDTLGGETIVIVQSDRTPLGIAAYRPVARQPRKFKSPHPDREGRSPADPGELLPDAKELPAITLTRFERLKDGTIHDRDTDTSWDATGRCFRGRLKGWTLEPVESIACKWFAWSAEYPDTEVFGQPSPKNPEPKKDDAIKEVAGAAEFLRLLPKPFATLKAMDLKARTVTLLLEGETVAKVWPVEPDAEVKILGGWGRLEQLTPGDRVWVWLKLNRNKEPVAVAMITDEPSEQDVHGDGLEFQKVEGLAITFHAKKQPARTLQLEAGSALAPGGQKRDVLERAERGARFFVQSRGEKIAALYDPDSFSSAHKKQMEWLRKRWESEGLPGTVSVQHVFSGELELLIDHEGMRWARSLKTGDVVHVVADPPIKAVVKAQTPWRERTQLRLVVGELAAADLKPGDRVLVKMTTPREDVLTGAYPPDVDRPRTKEQRVEWFLANTYCVCKVRGDVCTGHFYTLASCNPNGCGAPNETRKWLAEQIDKGLTDKQVWDELLKEKGALCLKPHLLP